MLGGIVQQIAENLPKPFRVRLHGRELLLRILIAQLQPVFAEKFFVGIDRILKLGLQVYLLHGEGKPAVLNAGKLQQLFHHIGQPPCLGDNDAHALFYVGGIPDLAVLNGLRPAVDGGKGGPQFVRHRRDKLVFDFLGLVDFGGHIVQCVGQIAYLIVVLLLDLDTVASRSDPLGDLGDARHRLNDRADKIEIGGIDQNQNGQPHQSGQPHNDHQLPVHQPQGSHIPYGRHRPAIDGKGGGHRHDMLPGGGVLPRPWGGPGVLQVQGPGNVRGPGRAVCRQSEGGKANGPVGTQKLHFHLVLPLKVAVDVGQNMLIILAFRPVIAEEIHHILRLHLKPAGHGGVVITAHGGGKGSDGKQHHKQRHTDGVDHPPPPDALHSFWFCHAHTFFFVMGDRRQKAGEITPGRLGGCAKQSGLPNGLFLSFVPILLSEYQLPHLYPYPHTVLI